MAVVYTLTLKTARMQEVIDAIDDAGAADPAKIEIGTGPAPALGTLLVTLELDFPSFVESTVGGNSIITMQGTPLSGDGVSNGTAAAARIKDGNGNVVASGLEVGTTADVPLKAITLNAVNISAGQTVQINSGIIRHG